MVLQWATKRLCKFFLKRLSRFLNEEIDLEQLDVQLGSGTGQLTDLVLNTDYINEQVKPAPFILRYGSIARIVVKLPCEIELDGLDILVAPRLSDELSHGTGRNAAAFDDVQHSGGAFDSCATGNCAYLGVNDGVRMIGQMVKSLLLGLRVKVTKVTVGVEGRTDSHGCLTVQIPQLDYGAEDPKDCGDPASIVKTIKFQNASVEIGSDDKPGSLVYDDVCEKDDGRADSKKDNGLSGSIRISIPCKEGAVTVPKINLELCSNPVQFRVSLDNVQQLLSLAYSFGDCKKSAQDESVYHDTSSFHECSIQGQRAAMVETRAADSFTSGKPTLPVIIDWMRKPELTEPDLAASMDEFFECFDAWNQSGSGSGLWNWTCSAFGAASSVSGASSISYPEVQMEYSISAKTDSVSGILFYDSVPHEGDGLELQFEQVALTARISQRELSFDAEIKHIEVTQLCPSAFQKQCSSMMAESVVPRFPVDLYSHDTSRIKLLRITSSLAHPAARLVAKQRQSGFGERTAIHTKLSIFIQPLVLWLDVDVVDRLSESLARLRVPSLNVATEGLEKVTRSSCKLNVSLPSLRTFLSAADHGNRTHMLAFDLAQSVGTSGIPSPILVYEQQDGKTGVHSFMFTVTDGSLYLVSGSSCDQIMRLESDSQGKASLEVKWTDNKKVESWIARKTWDTIAAQKNRCEGVGRNNSEFCATPSESETRTSVVELLKSTSAINVHVSIPKLRLDFSRADDIAFFMLLPSLACFKHEGKDVGLSPVAPQAAISFIFREVEAVVDLPCSVQPGTGSKNPSKTYDALQIKVSRLRAISGMALGGDPAAFFLNVQHDDCEVLGLNAEFLAKTQLLSCKEAVLGRGDGGGQNALASGAAGLTVTFMSWPGKEQLADVLVTGTIKGTTLMAKGGRFDWVPAFVTLIERCREPFENLGDAEPLGTYKRSHFLFDFQDIALCYEPTPKVQLKADVEAQTISPIAFVLAAAAFCVSSTEVAVTQMEQYQIWLRDLALHLVDTGLRRSDLQDYTPKLMQQAGYTQVANGPVIGALVKIRSGTEGPSWEVECVNNQLYFDTCCDTTAAFGRLVADLQQLFAPDIQKPAELHVRTMKGKSIDDSASESTTSERNAQSFEDESFDQESTNGSDGLFEGVVENAFACAKLVHVKKVHDGGNCSSSSRVCDSQKNDATVLFVQTASLTQSCEMDESHSQHRQADAPMFIEDYYLMEHGSHASMCSSQESESSRNSGGQDSEPKGGWYVDAPVDVFDSHVPIENLSPRKRSRKKSNSSYPQAVGRVIVSGLTAQWRLYGGSDWVPAEKNRQTGVCMEVLIDGMDLQYDAFAPTGLYASSLLVEICNLRMYDRSTDAPWRLVLGYYQKKSRPRESTSRAVRIRMDAVRPNPSAPLEEYRLSVALLPICLHLDQRHIDFFQKFFSQPTPPDKEASLPGAADGADSSAFNAADDAMLPFFQVCEMRPLIVRIDYVPRGIDFGALRGGNVFELLNLVSWKGVELQLKSVHAAGVYGWSSLMGLLFGEWLEDISKNQVHKLVTCCGPIRPLCAVSSGAAKLIVFPAEQYRRDRRLLRGMRKGAVAFLQSISLEALGLGANLAAGAHHILLHTEVTLGGSPRLERKDLGRRCQPGDTLEGFQQAYETIANGLERSTTSLLGNPVKVYQRGGGAGLAVASAIRASPTAILAPACAAADALRQALLGVRNGLDPERKRESDEKLRGPTSDV